MCCGGISYVAKHPVYQPAAQEFHRVTTCTPCMRAEGTTNGAGQTHISEPRDPFLKGLRGHNQNLVIICAALEWRVMITPGYNVQRCDLIGLIRISWIKIAVKRIFTRLESSAQTQFVKWNPWHMSYEIGLRWPWGVKLLFSKDITKGLTIYFIIIIELSVQWLTLW